MHFHEVDLTNNIYFYGSRPDISHVLNQCEIGLLSSKSEGLPLALLEYGLAKLAVISTKVGECESVVENEDNGILIKPEDKLELYEAIKYLIEKNEERILKSKSFNLKVEEQYSQKAAVNSILEVYKKLI